MEGWQPSSRATRANSGLAADDRERLSNVDFEVDLPFFTLNHAGQGISNDDAQTGSAYASGIRPMLDPTSLARGH